MKRGKKRAKKSQRKRMDIDLGELKSIIARAEDGPLGAEDREKLGAVVDTLTFLTQEIERKGTSIARLRKLIFGASTEKTDDVLGKSPPGGGDKSKDDEKKTSDKDGKKKPKGHGRNGADKYTGAEKVTVPHESLKRGDRCPECPKGKLYPLDPETLVRVTGAAPLQATVYELQKLRCNLCGFITTARAPESVGDKRYDEGAAAMIALLHYGTGLPFNRLDKLQKAMGIPLPSSTQWDVVAEAYPMIADVYMELVRQGAQGKVLYNDDTTMRILKLERDASDTRTGVFTSGIVSTTDEHKIALFFTGKQHAGENMADLLAHRASGLSPPIQMCDGISHNTAGDFESIVANCIAHARRKYVEVVTSFPDECEHVLETLREVYRHDADTKTMTPEKRLAHHQERSGPLMQDLETWCNEQLDEHLVEPNSGLGEAIQYMLDHWEKLTLFLRTPGAPLDNNTAERALKKAIIHRKNSLFYKSELGARVGDAFMSLIYTCELHSVDPFGYLVALQRHADRVQTDPGSWMPWNFHEAMAGIESTT